MAEFETHIEQSRDLTIITVAGIVSAQDVRATLDRLYADNPTRNILWDFTSADLSQLTTQDMQSIIITAKAHAPRRPGGRTALVASSEFAYGLGRMYGMLSEVKQHPVLHATFRSRDEALSWLGTDLDSPPS
jgi:hypothetical protein